MQRNRTAKKSPELVGDENIAASDHEVEINAWSNPVFDDCVCNNEETGYGEDPTNTSSVITNDSLYMISPTPWLSEKKPNDFSDSAVPQVHVDYQNCSACINPVYESNPAQDPVNEGPQGEGGEYCEPVVLSRDDVTKCSNPLYEELEKVKAQKSSSLNLNGDVIVDQDV